MNFKDAMASLYCFQIVFFIVETGEFTRYFDSNKYDVPKMLKFIDKQNFSLLYILKAILYNTIIFFTFFKTKIDHM